MASACSGLTLLHLQGMKLQMQEQETLVAPATGRGVLQHLPRLAALHLHPCWLLHDAGPHAALTALSACSALRALSYGDLKAGRRGVAVDVPAHVLRALAGQLTCLHITSSEAASVNATLEGGLSSLSRLQDLELGCSASQERFITSLGGLQDLVALTRLNLH